MTKQNELTVSTKALFKGPQEVSAILIPLPEAKGAVTHFAIRGREVLAGLFEVFSEAADPMAEAVGTVERYSNEPDGLAAFLSAGKGPLAQKAADLLKGIGRVNEYPTVVATILGNATPLRAAA